MGRRWLSLLRVRLLCLEFEREGPGDGSLSDIGMAEENAPENIWGEGEDVLLKSGVTVVSGTGAKAADEDGLGWEVGGRGVRGECADSDRKTEGELGVVWTRVGYTEELALARAVWPAI